MPAHCGAGALVHHRASVIIRTKDEQAGLGATLEAVLGQRHRPHQVIVIDSGSRDRTLEIAYRYPVCTLSIPRGSGDTRGR